MVIGLDFPLAGSQTHKFHMSGFFISCENTTHVITKYIKMPTLLSSLEFSLPLQANFAFGWRNCFSVAVKFYLYSLIKINVMLSRLSVGNHLSINGILFKDEGNI